MTTLKLLTSDEKLGEIRRLYFQTTKQTIDRDLDKALDLLKSMSTEEERDRAAVFMDGLAQMRSDWGRTSKSAKPKSGSSKAAGTGRKKAPAKRR
jgi:hypothetical protein